MYDAPPVVESRVSAIQGEAKGGVGSGWPFRADTPSGYMLSLGAPGSKNEGECCVGAPHPTLGPGSQP